MNVVKKFLSYENLVRYFYQPCDASSLGVVRFLFGLLMLCDLSEERGGAVLNLRWGDSRNCHFPLFPFMRIPSFRMVALLYGSMVMGTIGIMLGFKFRLSTLLFGIPYWYIFLLDKSFWNNHSYLFGIVTFLLMGSCANHFFSVDGFFDKSKWNADVPFWNYFILKFQFFMLYFLAGLKKTDSEWLEGYSMSTAGQHWVFKPFQILLTTDQIDYLIIHWFGFLLDLTIGFWMLLEITRPIALTFCATFHLMNSRLFSIGMFPYVCLATLPLFCEENWPKKILNLFKMSNISTITRKSPDNCIYSGDDKKISWKQKFVVGLLLTHCGVQTFLPYSHFITKGYNNWTNGLYGYSWDMMIHSWNTILVVVKVVDNDSGRESFLDGEAWTQNNRWTKHGDMIVQYAECVKNNLVANITDDVPDVTNDLITSENISIYIDVWCSLNSRFQQRMYNPNYDLLKARWSPFEPVEWLLPLLTEYNDFRTKINQISNEVYSWSNYSDVLFIADFPGLYLENFINVDVTNVTLTVLEGVVVYEIENDAQGKSVGVKLYKGDSVLVEVGVFHKIHTMGDVPSCYMYTYVRNSSEVEVGNGTSSVMYSPFPVIEDVNKRINRFTSMLFHIASALSDLVWFL